MNLTKVQKWLRDQQLAKELYRHPDGTMTKHSINKIARTLKLSSTTVNRMLEDRLPKGVAAYIDSIEKPTTVGTGFVGYANMRHGLVFMGSWRIPFCRFIDPCKWSVKMNNVMNRYSKPDTLDNVRRQIQCKRCLRVSRLPAFLHRLEVGNVSEYAV